MTNRPSSHDVICFVGISGKPSRTGKLSPLSEKTLSGRIVSRVEKRLSVEPCHSRFVRDNLVRKAPLTNGKLRYPTLEEFKKEWSSFERRLAKVKSTVVILLGALVSDFFSGKREIRKVPCNFADGRLLKWVGIDRDGMLVLAVAHPSYVGIYARKRIEEYAEMIQKAISSRTGHSAK
jgi:uracil-DNA glycosylase